MSLSQANRLRILYFLVFCCTASWLPLFADYCKERGLDGRQTGIILAIVPLMMLLVQPMYGMLADRLGYKRSFLISSLLAACSYAFFLYDGGFYYLIIITVFMAIFYNALQPVLDSLALELAEKDVRFNYGTLRIAGAAGWAFTGIITGQLIDSINMTVIFVVSTVSMLLTFLFALGLQIEQSRKVEKKEKSSRNIVGLLANKNLLFLLICVFLISAGTSAIWYFYSLYMKENGASASLVGYGLSFQGLCELPMFYLAAKIIGRLGIKYTLLLTVLATVVRMLLYSMVKNPVAAISIELLHGLSWSVFWVVCVESVNRLVDEEWRATGQSLLAAAYYGVGIIIGNFWTAYLAKSNMRIAEVFLLNAGIVAVVGVLIMVFMKQQNFKTKTRHS